MGPGIIKPQIQKPRSFPCADVHQPGSMQDVRGREPVRMYIAVRTPVRLWGSQDMPTARVEAAQTLVDVFAWWGGRAQGPHGSDGARGEESQGVWGLACSGGGEEEGAHLRVGEGGRSGTSTKPMLCRYCTYCCRKAKLSSFSQGSSRAPGGGASEDSQPAGASRLPAPDSGRWRRCGSGD